ncbi:MAG: hypothetical protein PHW65_00955 [Dehalococcoidales bacterium]|nr:hypothetical protein [Dehalococcoidales bacterium]
MDNETIVRKLRDVLDENEGLSYVKRVFVGDQQQIYGDSYPCIILETVADRLVSVLQGNVQENNLVIQIIPAILLRDREKALIGDATNKGILDFIADIKSALQPLYPSLDRTCLYFNLGVPDIADFPDMTGKYAVIEMNAVYRESI